MDKAKESIQRLMHGNETFQNATHNPADISLAKRENLVEGQSPYAAILSCSDSRVPPEMIFSAGLGELFVIRVAGNVLDDHQLGSIEYAVDHLDVPLVAVLGHTHCGAVHAAVNHNPDGHIKYVTDSIKEAIGETQDELEASKMNVKHTTAYLREHLRKNYPDVKVIGMMYDLDDSKVQIIEDVE